MAKALSSNLLEQKIEDLTRSGEIDQESDVIDLVEDNVLLMIKEESQRSGWHGESERHSEAARRGRLVDIDDVLNRVKKRLSE